MNAENTPVAVRDAPSYPSGMGLLMDPIRFEHVQRVAKMMAVSPLFPEHLRKGGDGQAVANAVLVFDMAFRMNENPLTVAQNIYFVAGKPGWLTTYMIARANQSGAFSDQIEWDIEGEGDALSVTAYATLAKGGRRAEATVDMAMAKAEGWTKNTKYQSMPERMLRWRSATALIRLYAPEVMIGMPSQIELETGDDMRDITPKYDGRKKPDPKPVKESEVEDVVEIKETDDTAEAKTEDDAKGEPEKPKKPDAGDDDTGADAAMEAIQRTVSDIIADIEAAKPAEVDGVLDLYDSVLEGLKESASDLHADIMTAATERQNSKD